MKAIATAKFEIDVSDWSKDEGLTNKQRIKQIQTDLEDFSVFMLHFTYENFKDIKVTII